MDRRDFELLDGFLAQVKKESLEAWLGLPEDAPPQEALKALVERRRWAQAQQANPKHREEALWLIRHQDLVKRALSSERAAWKAHSEARRHARNLDLLTHFITGTVAGGVLTADGLRAIHLQAEEYGLPRELVDQRIEEVLRRTGARRAVSREAGPRPAAGYEDFDDYYGLLEVSPDATLEEIERAHRARYRWARSLADLELASRTYARLDQAWRILRDPEKRRAYDARHAAWRAGLPDPARREAAPAEMAEVGAALPREPTASGIPPVRPSPAGRPRPVGAPPDGAGDPPAGASSKGGLRLKQGGARPPASPPTLPPAPAGSLGLNRTQGARLRVDGPAEREVHVTLRPRTVLLTIRNEGTGKMPGRVQSNRGWVQLSQEHLDPNAREQTLEVRIRRPPSRVATALVTIDAGPAGTRKVAFRVVRHSPVRAFLPVLLLGLVGGGAWGALLLRERLARPPPEQATLELAVEPPADSIRVEGELVGSGGAARWAGDPGPDGKVSVEVDLDGFAPWRAELPAAPGDHLARTVQLELVDDMTWRPGEDEEPVADPPAELAATVEARRSDLEACIRKALADRPGFRATLHLDLYIRGTGQARGLDITESNFDASVAAPCLRRVLRPLRFPLLPGDYTVLPIDLDVRIPGAPR